MSIKYYKEGKIAYFVLNRPDKYNAINPEMMELLEAYLMDFMEDRNLMVGVFSGEGKHFCSGADIKEWLPFVKETKDKPWRIPRTLLRGLEITKPLIAAVNGVAYGGGGEIALACDIRIAAESARFSWPEPSLGIIPRLGGTQRLPRIINRSKAMEILLTGRKVNAEEALEINLVSEVVEDEKLMDTAKEYAEKICKMAPLAIQAIKKCVNDGVDLSLEEGLELENRLGLALYDTEDYLEGGKAFREKREPDFKGM